MRPIAIFASVFALCFAASAAAGPLEDAVAAERRDDCTTAIPIYRTLAEQGNVQAFKRLGFFYEIGYCAKRDWLEAAKWYDKAIAAGDEAAAGSLGHIGRNWRFMYSTTPCRCIRVTPSAARPSCATSARWAGKPCT